MYWGWAIEAAYDVAHRMVIRRKQRIAGNMKIGSMAGTAIDPMGEQKTLSDDALAEIWVG